MSRDAWKTLSKASHITIEEKKSVFIAQAAPISCAKDAENFLCAVKKKYPDARHHVYAWRVGGDEIREKYSDDGEPMGTAGIPVLDVLRKNHIDDAILVVTRYFGGILLGTGGLARAYVRAASGALSEAVPTICRTCEFYHVVVDYSHLERLLFRLKKAEFRVDAPLYGTTPELHVYCRIGQQDELIRICMDATAGQATVAFVENRTMQVDGIEEKSSDATTV